MGTAAVSLPRIQGCPTVTPWVLLTSDDLGAIHGADWLSIIGMVVLSGLVGHGLMTWAQRHLDITVASLLTLGSPVISAIGAWLLFSQRLSLVQIAGAVVVLAALGAIVLEVRSNAVPVEIPLSVSAGDCHTAVVLAPVVSDQSGPTAIHRCIAARPLWM